MIEYVLLVVAIVLWYISRDPYPNIKGDYGSLLFGTTFEAMQDKLTMQMQHFLEKHSRYGPIAKVRIAFGKVGILVSDAPSAKQILCGSNFSRGPELQDSLIDMMPLSLFSFPTGATWKKHRKLLQPAFGPMHLNHTIATSEKVVDRLISFLKTLDGKAVNMFPIANAFALDVLGPVIFGYEFCALQSVIDEEYNEGLAVSNKIGVMVVLRFGLPSFIWPFVGAAKNNKDTKWIQSYFDRRVLPAIQERKKAVVDGTVEQKSFGMDVLQRLLEDDSLSDKEVVQEVMGFFLAGHDTTVNSLTSVMYEIAKDPQVQKRLRAEFQTVLKDEPLSMESIGQCKYLDAVIKETMRLHSVIHGITRVCSKEAMLMEHKIKPGVAALSLDTCYCPDWNLAQESALLGRTRKVQPRQMGEKQPVPGSYMPFGDGPMNCIGQKMSLLEMRK
ncbi:cytochrome P450 [Gorgonomyces haynaldii]|nr:cytochrome P450 [Gorgonomyces haynaldii]